MKTTSTTTGVARIALIFVLGLFQVELFGEQSTSAPPTKFEQAYAKWWARCQKPDVMLKSDSTIFYLPEYKEMVALGFPAIPEILAQLPQHPGLRRVAYDITRIRIPREKRLEFDSNPKELEFTFLRNWWSNAEQDATARFTEHATKYKTAKREARNVEAAGELEKIKDIGRTALPHLFANIARGDTDLIPVASALMDGAFPPTATAAECAAWWNDNKQKWTLPAND